MDVAAGEALQRHNLVPARPRSLFERPFFEVPLQLCRNDGVQRAALENIAPVRKVTLDVENVRFASALGAQVIQHGLDCLCSDADALWLGAPRPKRAPSEPPCFE